MSAVLIAAAPSRPIVIKQGGTPWWVPLLVGLLVAGVAALASYYATWRFKQADVNRENALRAADLVDEAERLASRQELWAAEDEGGATAASRLIQRARVRSQPLEDANLDDRFRAALTFLFDLVLEPGDEPGRGRHWFGDAAANIRAGLVPHLAAPKLIRRRRPVGRVFPTTSELHRMEGEADSTDAIIDKLVEWAANRAQNQA